jgi:hypothetical protein
MLLNPELLAALAGLPGLPRTPLTINPCPEGYILQLVGGEFTCVLEGVDGKDILQANQNQAASLSRQLPVTRGSRGGVSTP